MSIFYSDNVNRAARVGDLANTTGFIQQAMVEINDRMRKNDKNTYEALGRVAKAAGFPSIDDYVQNALKAMPEAERLSYLKLRDQVRKDNQNCAVAMDVIGVFGAIAVGAGIAGSARAMTFFGYGRQVVGMRAVGEAIAEGMQGISAGEASLSSIAEESLGWSVSEIEAVSETEKSISGASAIGEAGEVAAEVATEVTTTIKVLRVGSKVLGALAILATVGVLVYEAVEGAKQKDKLQGLIKTCAAKRFGVKRMQLRMDGALSLQIDMAGLIIEQDTLNDLVADGTITEAKMKEKIAKKTNELAVKYKAAVLLVQNYNDVDAALRQLDDASNSWTQEDPHVPEMLQYLKDNKIDVETDKTE